MPNATYICCLDEGHGAVDIVPNELESSTALMVNPSASVSVLLDAANARASRIVDVTKHFLDLETVAGLDLPTEDACRLLSTVSAMSYEVCRLLVAAQTAEACGGADAMRLSYRQTVEAAEALVNVVNIDELESLPGDKEKAIVDAIFEMEGNIGAARDDFLGAKEVSHD